jgi:hypothetical protein
MERQKRYTFDDGINASLADRASGSGGPHNARTSDLPPVSGVAGERVESWFWQAFLVGFVVSYLHGFVFGLICSVVLNELKPFRDWIGGSMCLSFFTAAPVGVFWKCVYEKCRGRFVVFLVLLVLIDCCLTVWSSIVISRALGAKYGFPR